MIESIKNTIIILKGQLLICKMIKPEFPAFMNLKVKLCFFSILEVCEYIFGSDHAIAKII